jgi:nucleotidyltransferase substrate binding protein (TIGR01987 family)
MEDIRWHQRFSNYKKALSKLAEVAENREFDQLSELEKEGLIQRFEYTFELAWKTLQDLLRFKGYMDISGPNPVLDQSFKDGYINNAESWKKLKKARELTSHTYNSETADEVSMAVLNEFYPLFVDLLQKFENEKKKDNK